MAKPIYRRERHGQVGRLGLGLEEDAQPPSVVAADPRRLLDDADLVGAQLALEHAGVSQSPAEAIADDTDGPVVGPAIAVPRSYSVLLPCATPHAPSPSFPSSCTHRLR